MSGAGFDYEDAVWGREAVSATDRSLAGVRLAEALRVLPERGTLLEFGCGAGRMLAGAGAARPGLALAGIDLSRAALAVAAQRLPGADLRGVDDPAAPLPVREGEFDAAMFFDVLEHVLDPRATLIDLHRSLAPGGVLHAYVPCEGDALALWRWLPARMWQQKSRNAGHIQRFTRAGLFALLGDVGFEVTRARYSLHLLGNVADVVVHTALAVAARRGTRATTGDLLALSARDPGALAAGDRGERGSREGRVRPGAGARVLGAGVRAVDAALWLEARALCRLPSWSLHVTARRQAGRRRRREP